MNRLFYGDNLDILRKKIKDETVDLCYIDPLFTYIGNEVRAQAQAFMDTWTWDDLAIGGFSEILANDRGRFRPQLVALIQGLDCAVGIG